MGNELNGAKGDKGAGRREREQGNPGAREQVKAYGLGIARIGESIIPRLISHAGILFPSRRAPIRSVSHPLASPPLAERALLFLPRGFLSRRTREDARCPL